DPFFFIRNNHSCSPNILADVAAEHFLQVRNDPMSNAVAQRCEIFVRSILAKFQPVLADVIVDLFAPDAKKRAHDRQVDAVDSSCRNFPHRRKAGAAGATKQIDQKRFDQIVGVMRDEDCPALLAPCDFSKECVARFTRGSFDRHLLLLPERADVGRAEFKFKATDRCRASASLARGRSWHAEPLPNNFLVVALYQPFYKLRIGIARSSAQSMIQVANDKSFVTQADQPVQQRDGITPAGNTDQIGSVWGKVVGYSRVGA